MGIQIPDGRIFNKETTVSYHTVSGVITCKISPYPYAGGGTVYWRRKTNYRPFDTLFDDGLLVLREGQSEDVPDVGRFRGKRYRDRLSKVM